MSNYLVISALGENRAELLGELTGAVQDCKCSILDSRALALGNQLGVLMLVTGNWNTLAKLEVQLEKLTQNGGPGAKDLLISTRRTEQRAPREDAVPYAIEVVALDQPGLLFRLVDFLNGHGVQIDDLNGRSYRAAHTGATMCSVNIAIGIPADVHITMLREEFMDFCDQFNWDAVMEPIKG